MEFVLDGSDLDDVGIEEIILEELREFSSGEESLSGWMCEGHNMLLDVIEEVSVIDGLVFIHSLEFVNFNFFGQICFERAEMASVNERDLSQLRPDFLFFLFGFKAFLL